MSDIVQRALDVPREVTLDSMARAAGMSRSSLKAYRIGAADMPAVVRQRLAAYLESHAKRLLAIARELGDGEGPG